MRKQTITFGFSPCPNDTFILDALYNGKLSIDTSDIDFKWIIEDVQELNERALRNEIDITKMSYGVYNNILANYILMNAGSALGKGCGPLVIYKNELTKPIEELRIAIPGINTTANFLLSKAYPQIPDAHKIPALFSDIEQMILDNEVDLGLIIHENRFTYQSKGLKLLKDLGQYWEEDTGLHIPLGGFCINRKFNAAFQRKINGWIKKSVEFAFKNRESSKSWIKKHSQELDDRVINSHIELYVNAFSKDLGTEGKRAIAYMLEMEQSDEKKSNYFDSFFVE